MCITQFATRRVAVAALAACTLLAPSARAADRILVPIVAAVHGQNEVLWETEIRFFNRTDSPRQVLIVDWIGSPAWPANDLPSQLWVPARSILSVGGGDLFFTRMPASGAAGLAVIDADDGLLVQTAVLSGSWGPDADSQFCPSFNGGGEIACRGRSGAGPIIENLAFASPGEPVFLPWLHTDESRRTNLVLINPDAVPAHVTVSVQSQDGLTTKSEDQILPPHSYNQTNDLFAGLPWSAIREANVAYFKTAGASARIVSDSRLLAMGYVISNVNNSLTVSTPH